jgi:hypothetical protein
MILSFAFFIRNPLLFAAQCHLLMNGRLFSTLNQTKPAPKHVRKKRNNMLKNANPFMTLRAKCDYAPLWQIASRLEWSAISAFGLPFLFYWLTAAPTIYNPTTWQPFTSMAALLAL